MHHVRGSPPRGISAVGRFAELCKRSSHSRGIRRHVKRRPSAQAIIPEQQYYVGTGCDRALGSYAAAGPRRWRSIATWSAIQV